MTATSSCDCRRSDYISGSPDRSSEAKSAAVRGPAHGAEIVELDDSHVIMIFRPEPVADLIARALAAVVAAADVRAPRQA